MRLDIHTHNNLCGHAEGKIEEYIQEAVSKGLDYIGISDHAPLWCQHSDHPLPDLHMAKSDFANYYNEMLKLKEKYKGKINVLRGLELDYFAGCEDLYQEILEEYEFDYLIGSVHYVNEIHIYDSKRWEKNVDILKFIEDYVELIKKLVKSRMADIIAHLDSIKIWKEISGNDFYQEIFFEKLTDILYDEGDEQNTVIEINASGIKKAGEVFPALKLIKALSSIGFDFTYGSDAHRPEDVGFGYDTASSLLNEIGIDKLAIFENRQKKYIYL